MANSELQVAPIFFGKRRRRHGDARQVDAFAIFEHAARDNHEPERDRKLLVHRRELERLNAATREKGLTLVPTRIYFKGSRAKVELALAKGKDLYDKRQSIRAREEKRDMERALRSAGR